MLYPLCKELYRVLKEVADVEEFGSFRSIGYVAGVKPIFIFKRNHDTIVSFPDEAPKDLEYTLKEFRRFLINEGIHELFMNNLSEKFKLFVENVSYTRRYASSYTKFMDDTLYVKVKYNALDLLKNDEPDFNFNYAKTPEEGYKVYADFLTNCSGTILENNMQLDNYDPDEGKNAVALQE